MFCAEGGFSCHCVCDGLNQYDDIREGVNFQDDVRGYRKDVCRCL
jgi:hypothetical protein